MMEFVRCVCLRIAVRRGRWLAVNPMVDFGKPTLPLEEPEWMKFDMTNFYFT